ncbi:MAG: cache domain-containing protein [Zoogloea sp.]|jgi:hypothetical protein|nr:cache domain-containing protein [Zoogloea sp.]
MSVVVVRRALILALVGLGLGLGAAPARSELPAELKTRVEAYQKKMIEWAAHPSMVKAVKDANAASPVMTNSRWDDLPDTDPAVKATISGPVSDQLKKWEEDKNINKLFLRDGKGQVVAASSRAFLYNAANRPHVAAALKGQAFHAQEIKPDPATQVKSVQVAVPVLDGGKPIGVLNAAVTAN